MRFLRASLIPFAFALFALTGCKEEEVIKKEEVTYADRETLKLRVAYLTHGKSMWFIRMSGPALLVEKSEPAFEAFVRSAKFDKKNLITFEEPKDWKKDLPSPRQEPFLAYRIDGKPKEIQVKVTRLVAAEFGLLKNLHRWQSQVNVPLAETLEEAELAVKREKVGEHEVHWVKLDGVGIHTVSKPPEPVADDHKKFLFGMRPKKAGAGPFKYKAPENWTQQAPRPMILDVYTIEDGKDVAELTFSIFGGGIGENIDRWRGELKLPKLGDAAERSAHKRKIAGIDSYYVDLDNPRGPEGKNRILAAVIPMGKQLAFVKMTGPRDLVGQEKAAFETFLDSFKR